MSKVDLRARAIKDLAQESRRLSGVVEELVRGHHARPAPDSRAAAEVSDRSTGSDLWDLEPVPTCDRQAVLLLRSASDHLSLLSYALLHHHASAMTLSRGCLEAAGKAAYTGDPSLDVAERTRRWFNELLLGVHEQAHGLAGYGYPEEAAAKRKWIAEALAAARNIAGWGEVVEPKNAYTAPYVGEPRPKISALIDALLEVPDGRRFGRAVYQVNSAVAHANAHGLSIAGLVTVDADGVARYPADPLTASQIVVRHLPTLGGFYTASLRVANRMGWDEAPLRQAAKRALQRWESIGRPG